MSSTTPTSVSKESDMMLWIGAGAVVGIGLIWLIVSQFSGPDSAPIATTAAPAAESPGAETNPAVDQPAAPGTENPLRLAEMAYQAGMLVEPEELSAWTLYTRALEQDPGSEAARQGVERVATDLLRRSASAVEQGRYGDARATITRILEAIPDHEGASSLQASLEAQEAAERARAAQAQARRAEQARAEAAQSRTANSGDPGGADGSAGSASSASDETLDALRKGFDAAMAGNRLLVPADDSARYYVEQLVQADASDERSFTARDVLVSEMISRSNQSIEALDFESAETWIDEAEALTGSSAVIDVQRQRLTAALVKIESTKPMPASEMTVLSYAAPEYPRNALSRGIEGWVDVEFTVAANGRTQDISVTESSHERYFRDEAVAAVEDWSFEPRTFMGQTISQRAYTRVRFVLGE